MRPAARFGATGGTELRVLHFCETILPRSETFVQQRLEGDRFRSAVAGWGRVAGGLDVPCPSVILPQRGWSSTTSLTGRAARRLVRPLNRARQTVDMLGLLARGAPSVVHAHFGSTGAAVARVCRMAGIPLVTSFYGFDAGQLPRQRGGARAYASLFATGAAFTAEGPTLARTLVALGAPPERVKLLPLAVPTWVLNDPPRPLLPTAGEMNLLQIARFVDKKGIDVTLRALALARRAGVAARLTLVGEGTLRPAIEALIGELGLGEAVSLPGFVAHRDLADLFARAHIYVQPSRTAPDGDTEGGHPVVVLEAQARGLPVLATRHGDIPLVVQHGVTGLLCAENDHEALSRNMITLATQPETVAAMGLAARKIALRRHHPHVVRSLQERIYREAIRQYHMKNRPICVLPRLARLPDPFVDHTS